LQHDLSARPAGHRLWQRNYYEHVIRDYDSLQHIREYITNNPLAWALDRENPSFTPVSARTTPPTDPWQV